MGAKCCFEIFNEFRLLCCWNFICAWIVPESSRCWQHHSNYQITTRLFHILQDIPCDLFVLIFLKLSTENELWVLKYTIIHHFLESGTRYYAGFMKSYHIICHSFYFIFFLHVVHAIHKVYYLKKKCSDSQWKHATIHIACQPVSCKIIFSLIVIFIVWNILTLN